MRLLFHSFILVIFLLGSSTSFAKPRRIPKPKTKILKSSVYTDNENSLATKITVGFADSSFDYSVFTPASRSFCYLGRLESVCRLIKRAANEMVEAYKGGDHDTIELKSCEIKALAVQVQYTLHDDWGGYFEVDRTISKCQ